MLPCHQVSSGRHPCSCAPHLQQPTGSLTRTLQYIYSNNGPWGAVRSLVVQEQMLLVGPGGRLVLIITQRMPDLPTGGTATSRWYLGHSLWESYDGHAVWNSCCGHAVYEAVMQACK